jgi:DNA-binding winged helix-turn-helix (wHTH) protein
MTSEAPQPIYSFAGFTLDLSRGTLLGPDSMERRLRPKSLLLLRHMVKSAGRLIGRDEVMAKVWPGAA